MWFLRILATIFLGFMFALITMNILEIEYTFWIFGLLYFGYTFSFQFLFRTYEK